MIVLYPFGYFLYLNSGITESVEKVDHWFLSDHLHRIHWTMSVCWLHCQSLLVSYLLLMNKIISIVHKIRIHQTKLLIWQTQTKRKWFHLQATHPKTQASKGSKCFCWWWNHSGMSCSASSNPIMITWMLWRKTERLRPLDCCSNSQNWFIGLCWSGISVRFMINGPKGILECTCRPCHDRLSAHYHQFRIVRVCWRIIKKLATT